MAQNPSYPFAYSKYSGQLVESKVSLLFSADCARLPGVFVQRSRRCPFCFPGSLNVLPLLNGPAVLSNIDEIKTKLHWAPIRTMAAGVRVEPIRIYRISGTNARYLEEGASAIFVKILFALATQDPVSCNCKA